MWMKVLSLWMDRTSRLSRNIREACHWRLFQDPLRGTAPHMTIEENLALAYLRASKGTAPFSRISKKDKEFFREQLSLLHMGLEDRMKNPVGLLSGGQRQALTLLMATMVPPDLLLLDEHTAALDPATADKVLKLTQEIIEKNNTTCLMVTHNMHQALTMGNRTLMMDDGKICTGCGRGRACQYDGERSSGKIPQQGRKRSG